MPKNRSNGTNLYYEIHGQSQPLLFIHGLGSSTRDWEFQVQEFARSYRVITFDLRGHGQSEKPVGPYSMALFAADAAALLTALGIDRAHVVGVSLGGCVGLQLALDAPLAVKTLTLVNSVPEFVPRSFRQRLVLWQRLAIVRLFGMRRLGVVLSKRLFIKPDQAPLRKTFAARWAENDKCAYLDTLRAMIGWSVTSRLGEIRCPTLVITSDQDYTPVSLKEAYTAKIPDAELVTIADSRHALPVERPQEFNRVLWAFLAKHR